MILKPGQRVEYYAGLGGYALREGIIKRIDLEQPVQGPLAEYDTSRDQVVFVDLMDGTWTYADRVARIVAEE